MATNKEYQALIDSLSGECERLHKENEELRALLPCKGQKMTREEAIKELQESLDTLREYDIAHSSRLKQALDMAIQALSQEPCTDAVSRAEVKKIVDFYTEQYDGIFHVNESIDKLPSVTQKSGKWDRLYSWLNDMRLGIAPDETVDDIDERHCRESQTHILDEIMEWMIKAESEDKE